jgi:hypothetical protein
MPFGLSVVPDENEIRAFVDEMFGRSGNLEFRLQSYNTQHNLKDTHSKSSTLSSSAFKTSSALRNPSTFSITV